MFESLGELKGKAWEVGKSLAAQYSGNELAERVFAYARDHVTYTSDVVQFGYDEFARNADEVAEEIESWGSSRGDCEDYTILLAVMFRAAGFRSAVVLAPEHTAALVYLPDYPGANTYWDFKGEGGWVWAEGTGRTNPLGWTPPKLMRSDLHAYEIVEEDIFAAGASEALGLTDGSGMIFGGSSFFSMIFLLWLLSAFRRR
ncbi:MAG: transglutaminase domain-containing protein [Candidatus Hadarchaeaceae archaeon]